MCAALAPLRASHAQKLDTVTIENGDHITGEIEKFDRGKLSFSTDDIGTLAIEWDKIVRLVSPRLFEVELITGQRFLGSLSSPGSRQLAITLEGKSDTVALIDVAVVRPQFLRTLDRFTGFVDLGFTYQQANHLHPVQPEHPGQLSRATVADGAACELVLVEPGRIGGGRSQLPRHPSASGAGGPLVGARPCAAGAEQRTRPRFAPTIGRWTFVLRSPILSHDAAGSCGPHLHSGELRG